MRHVSSCELPPEWSRRNRPNYPLRALEIRLGGSKRASASCDRWLERTCSIDIKTIASTGRAFGAQSVDRLGVRNFPVFVCIRKAKGLANPIGGGRMCLITGSLSVDLPARLSLLILIKAFGLCDSCFADIWLGFFSLNRASETCGFVLVRASES